MSEPKASDHHPYELRITGDGSGWGEIMQDAYDDLMAAACESCTPEQMEQLVDYICAELRSEPVSMRTFDSIETALTIAEKEVEIEELKRENDELCKENEDLAHRCAELESTTHGTLTAEQVCEAIERNFTKVAVIDDGGEKVEWREGWVCNVGINYKAIADELNTRAERTCRNTSDSNYFHCSVCRKKTYRGEETFNYCPNCGAKVVE